MESHFLNSRKALPILFTGLTQSRGDKVSCTSNPSGAQQIEPGSALNLTCLSRSGELLVWFKDGKPLKDDVISIQTPGSKVRSLVTSIQNASTADSGTYECKVQGGSRYEGCEWRLDIFGLSLIHI